MALEEQQDPCGIAVPPARDGRRRFLGAIASGFLGAAVAGLPGVAQAAPETVVVVTSYQEELFSRVEAAFEKANPGYRLQLVWRMPQDALSYLSQPGQSGADIYWAASPRTFATLKSAGALAPLPLPEATRKALPGHLGATTISDPEGYFLATELAGYGFVVNPKALAAAGLPLPRDWDDLTDPRYAGRISLPIPARVGFAPVLVEVVLQAWGWEKGWALWSEITANARTADRGGSFVSDEIAAGRTLVGISIDFFVASAIANGAPLRFIYPAHTGINPGQIALTAKAPHPKGALAFAQFILSDAGQQLLAHPDIRKLPARPSAYAGLPKDYYNPFTAAGQGAYAYDGVKAQPRLAVSAALFQQALIREQGELTSLWRRLQGAEARPAGTWTEAQRLELAALRERLGRPLISAEEAADPQLASRFRDRLEGADAEALSELERRWADADAARRKDVAARLAALGV